MHTVRVECWRVEIVLRELEEETAVYFFSTEGLGRLAIEWAYANRIAELRSRADVDKLVEHPDLNDGSWKLQELLGKKITWWQRTPKGYIGMKDYFTCHHDVFYREIIDEGPPPMPPPPKQTFCQGGTDGFSDDRGKVRQAHPADPGWP